MEPMSGEKGATDLGSFFVKHKVATILVVVALLACIFVETIYLFYHSKVEKLQYSDGTPEVEGTIDEQDEEVQSEAAIMEQTTADLEEKEVVQAEGEVFADEKVINILLIGTDERSEAFSDNARGDTCMLLSANQETGSIKLVSFERGMGMPILDGAYKGQYDWLTHTFRYGGAKLMMQEIQECFKIEVNYYVRVNITTFMRAIDAVGGVDIELTQAEVDYINNQEGYAKGHIREMGVADEIQIVKVGDNHLNGATAMVYARCRYIDSDWKRVERQRNVIQQLMKSVKDCSLTELNGLLDDVLPLIQTNLTEKEITALLAITPKFLGTTAKEMTIPVKGTYGSMKGMGGRSMYATDFQSNADILKEFLYE